jgi:hypothetical protein
MARLKLGDRKDWSGGFARWNGSSWTYYLRRRDPRLGRDDEGRARQAVISTGAHSEELARVHLEVFEANPLAYDPSRVSIGRAPLFFTDALCAEHLDHLAAPILQGGKANTPQHCATVRMSLMWWRTHLGQLNLRALTVEELRARIPVADVRDQAGALLQKAPKGRKHKLAAFKHFVTWLRRVRGDGLNQGEGPDMSTLVLPQAHGHRLKLHDPKLALERQRKGQRALEGFPELRKALASQQRWAWAMHALDLQADTGWHTSEIQRWVSLGGLVEPMPAGREKEAAALLLTIHKSGQEHRTPVSSAGLEAARALYEWASAREGTRHHGWDPTTKQMKEFNSQLFPKQQYERLCVRLCEQNGIAKFGPSHMRHAFATLNSGSGHSAKSIGAFLGHSEGQKGALVKSTYADPRSQIDGPAMEARPIPVRLQSPLEKLLEKPTPKRKRGSTATNMPPATA